MRHKQGFKDTGTQGCRDPKYKHAQCIGAMWQCQFLRQCAGRASVSRSMRSNVASSLCARPDAHSTACQHQMCANCACSCTTVLDRCSKTRAVLLFWIGAVQQGAEVVRMPAAAVLRGERESTARTASAACSSCFHALTHALTLNPFFPCLSSLYATVLPSLTSSLPSCHANAALPALPACPSCSACLPCLPALPALRVPSLPSLPFLPFKAPLPLHQITSVPRKQA